MNDGTRSVLHEVMEQQTLSIAKAGIIAQLNARTSILAAANPIESQWNSKKTIVENIQLPHTLLSRFDLIFLILDPQDEVCTDSNIYLYIIECNFVDVLLLIFKAKLFQLSNFFHEPIPSLSNFVDKIVGNRKKYAHCTYIKS